MVTINGASFGTQESTPVAFFGAATSPGCTWRSDSQVECETPAGLGVNNSIVVRVGALNSTRGDGLFSYDGEGRRESICAVTSESGALYIYVCDSS